MQERVKWISGTKLGRDKRISGGTELGRVYKLYRISYDSGGILNHDRLRGIQLGWVDKISGGTELGLGERISGGTELGLGKRISGGTELGLGKQISEGTEIGRIDWIQEGTELGRVVEYIRKNKARVD